MSNINWSQILTNFASGMNNNVSNFVNKNANLLGAGPQMYNPPQQQAPQPQILPQTTQQLAQTTAELALLNQQQTANMLKDLLQMPKNFEQLLTQLSTMPKAEAQQTALMLLASSLNTSQLASMLQTNSKEAMTNLYKMLAQFNQLGLSIKDEQTSELSKLISLVSASATSDVQSLRTTMLMYLPWLPLTDPNAFKLEIASAGADGGVGADDFITLLISTENYGNIQATIYKTEQDGIKIELTTSQTFPQKDFVELMKEESKKHNININLLLAIKEAFNKKKEEKSETQVFMNTSPGINPFLLLISNTVIKHIHTIDYKENLREQRKEKVQNGES